MKNLLPVMVVLFTCFSPIVLWGQNLDLGGDLGGGERDGPEETVEIEVKVVPATQKQGETIRVQARFLLPANRYITKQEEFFFLRVEGLSDVVAEAPPPTYPEGIKKGDLIVYKDSVTLERTLNIAPNAEEGEHTLSLTMGYQLCDEGGTCFMPQEEKREVSFTVQGASTTQASISLGTFLQFLLLALLGGILLNVMPCVFPLLSVKALSLVKQVGEDRKQIITGAMFYAAGIMLSFLVIALLVIGLKASGELVGWGFQFQNPVFVLVLASIIYLFALSMFDVYVISLPGMETAAKASSTSGYAGNFLTGIFAVLVATPCTAPFLGAALGFAFSQPPLIIITILLGAGAGFALPFVLLGIWPKLLNKVPKPGEWMNVFKEAMGFLLIGTAVYLLSTLYKQIGGEGLVGVLAFFVVLSFAAWIYGRISKPGSPGWKQWTALVLAVALIAGGSFVFIDMQSPGSSSSGMSTYLEGNWEEYSPGLLESYLSEGSPVFVNAHAAWCTNCKVNEAAVLSKKDILEAFKDRGVKLLHADYTQEDPAITALLENLGRAGVPAYVLYTPETNKPKIFPEILTKQMIFSALKDL